MPFGLLTGISAGSSVLSGLFGGKAAKSAAKQQADAAQHAIGVQADQLKYNTDDIWTSQGWANNALYDAKREGQGMVSDATTAGQGAVADATRTGQGQVADATLQGLAGVRDATSTGQADVTSGVEGANAGLTDSQKRQLALYQPFIQSGTNSLASLQELAGANGPLSNKFSFNPSDLAKDPGYAFTLQQGQDALQRSAAAKGQLFSSGTLKHLAGYTTGTANQYFGDAFSRAKQTFDTNQNQALSRISTLQNLAGMGYSGSAAGANAIGTTEAQRAANLTRGGEFRATLGQQGSEFGANLGEQGAQFGANLGEQGAQFGANLGEQGAQYNANLGEETGNRLSLNTLAASAARTGMGTHYADVTSGLLTGQGDALAKGTVGATNSWLSALDNGTRAALKGLAGRSPSTVSNASYNDDGSINAGY